MADAGQWQILHLDDAKRSLARDAYLSRKTAALVNARWDKVSHNTSQFPLRKVLGQIHKIRLQTDSPKCILDLNPISNYFLLSLNHITGSHEPVIG